MILALRLALLLLAAQPVNDPEADSTFSERQPVRLDSLPAETAFAAFRDICMAGFPDGAAFDRAAAASGLGFVRSDRAERDTQEWSSRHGQVVLRTARGRGAETRRERRDRRAGREGRPARVRWVARCDFWLAIQERMELGDLVAAIGASLAPSAMPQEEIVGIAWDAGPAADGGRLKLIYTPSTDGDPRLFTLSLQLLPANPSF